MCPPDGQHRSGSPQQRLRTITRSTHNLCVSVCVWMELSLNVNGVVRWVGAKSNPSANFISVEWEKNNAFDANLASTR